jgi:hypothetical protein
MNAVDIIVILAAVAALAGLGWFFFGPRKATAAVLAGGVQRLEVTVKGGYRPEVIRVRQGVPVELAFDRQESGDCTSRVVFPDFRASAALPAWQRTTVRLDPGQPGEFGFACGMNMIRGTLIVEPVPGGAGSAADGPGACESSGEQLGLARMYEQSGDDAKAIQAYELAASSTDQEVAHRASAGLAVFLRRERRFDESAAAWERVLAHPDPGRGLLTTLQRRAIEALAIHHEHRARDLDAARRYAQTLRAEASGPFVAGVEHRLGRIDRKMKAAERTKGSPVAAPLLD